jgi:hypothetical protein
VNLELIHIAISLVFEVDADDLAGELATDAGENLDQGLRATLLQGTTSTVMVAAAVVSIAGTSEAGTCKHERKRDQEHPSGPNDAHSRTNTAMKLTIP